MWIKIETIMQQALPQAKQFDNLVSAAHASYMTCPCKLIPRVLTLQRFLHIDRPLFYWYPACLFFATAARENDYVKRCQNDT